MEGDVPKSAYVRHIKRNKDAGNWFTFYRPYTKILPKLTSLFLQDLINLASTKNIIREEITGKEYILCTREFLVNSSIGWTVKEQNDHFHLLREKGFILSIRRGIPAKRWIHIDLLKIEQNIDEYEDSNKMFPNGNDCSDPNGNDYVEERIKEEKNKGCSQAHNNSGFFKSEYPEDCVQWSIRLYRKLDSEKVFTSRKKPKQSLWPMFFSDLKERRNPAEIEEILSWYLDNINEPWIPLYHSAKTFCENFAKLVKSRKTEMSKYGKWVKEEIEETKDVFDPVTKRGRTERIIKTVEKFIPNDRKDSY